MGTKNQRQRFQLGPLDLVVKYARQKLAEGTILPSAYHPVLTSNDSSGFEKRVDDWYRRITALQRGERDYSIITWIHNETMRIKCTRSVGIIPTHLQPLWARVVHVKAKLVTSLLERAYENGLSIKTGKRLLYCVTRVRSADARS